MYERIRKCLVFLVLIVSVSCNQSKPAKFPTLPGYDLNHPFQYTLRDELDEISGIVYYPKDTTLLAINDEYGILYKIYLRQNVEVLRWRFDKGGDFEDLALVDSTFYVLKSKGNIMSVKVLSKDSVLVSSYKMPKRGKMEYETLYHDAEHNRLVLICKDCKDDSKTEISAWAFDLVSKSFSATPVFKLDAKIINRKLGSGGDRIKPSAAALHPITKELYVISSVNKALVIVGKDGGIKACARLDPDLFKQPEGLTFTPKGDLIISNESAEVGPANIFIFKYKSN